MPYFLGIGIHVLIALFFAMHAVRTGQNYYWLFILLAFPLLGSVVYFVAIYLPQSRFQRHARALARSTVKAIDPSREVREAQTNYDFSPTAQNQIRLAQALLAVTQPQAALEHFEASLKGPFANDLDIRWGAAQAAYSAGQPQKALEHLQQIAQADIRYRAEAVGLMVAKAYAQLGDQVMARKSFAFVYAQSGSFDVMAEYAVWAAEQGDWGLVEQLETDIQKAMTHWTRQQLLLNKDMLDRLKAAMALRPTS